MYRIRALTNLHVGSGDQNFGIVDKLVQRDTVSRLPVIRASSFKGSLKEYSNEVSDAGVETLLQNIFGEESNPGSVNFFSARLLAIPVRSTFRPYLIATCPMILKEMLELAKVFGIKITKQKDISKLSNYGFEGEKEFVFFEQGIQAGNMIEEYEINDKNTVYGNAENSCFPFLGFTKEGFVLIRDDVFQQICLDLPVVARNRLDDNNNLWYEELVPRLAEFFTFLSGVKHDINVMESIFEKTTSSLPVQIGANASVGMGFCSIKKF